MIIRNTQHTYLGNDNHSFWYNQHGERIFNCVWCRSLVHSDNQHRINYGRENIYVPYCSPKCFSEDPENEKYKQVVLRFISRGGKEEFEVIKAIEDEEWEKRRALKAENEVKEKRNRLVWQVLKLLFWCVLIAYFFYKC
jgi:hypothetical protein